jgi:glutathione synthase/RimK-type ligase-like ATP-grasp enzyme
MKFSSEETTRLFSILHDTIFSHVFSFLSLEDNINKTSLVSKSWHKLIQQQMKKEVLNTPIVQFIVIGNLENRRVAFFQSAVIDLQHPPAKLISWETVLQNMMEHNEQMNINQWKQLLQLRSSYPNRENRPVKFVIRIDSPGENWSVEKQLIEMGSDDMYANETSGMRIRPQDIQNLQFDLGAIKYQRQWYLGFKEALFRLYGHVNSAVNESLVPIEFHWMNHPNDILVMFDKRICWTHLNQHNIPLPKAFLNVESFDHLKQVINENEMSKVFVKLAHGSSASGVVAFSCLLDKIIEESNNQVITRQSLTGTTRTTTVTTGRFPYTAVGTTSVELERNRQNPTQFNLYNSLKIRRYTEDNDLRDIINTLCGEKVIVEEWVPKAKYETRNFDLRIVVINGDPQHFVVRTSNSPMTNLHLGNARGDNQVFLKLINQYAPGSWERVKATCSRLARECFPESCYMGVDVLISKDFKEHVILEVNAFGDLIPRIYNDEDMDTYHAEVKSMVNRVIN